MDAPFVVPEVQGGDGDVLDKLLVLQKEKVAAVLATVVEATGSTPARAGFKMIVTVESQFGTVGGGAFENAIVERCREMIASTSQPALVRHSTRDLGMCCGGTMTVFLEPHLPAPRLVVFGAGHVASAVCTAASPAGFEVTVCDGREEWLTDERFPDAKKLILVDADSAVDRAAVASSSYVLVMTHDHALDEEVLVRLLRLPALPRFLGVIGSRSKRVRFAQRLEARGFAPSIIDKIRMPVGLDLGGRTAAEIAVAVTAELISVRYERDKVAT